jgi:hypothetical protein
MGNLFKFRRAFDERQHLSKLPPHLMSHQRVIISTIRTVD